MAKYATASDALAAALADVDAKLTNINIDEQLDLYIELIDRRAKIQQAIAASGGGGGGGGGDASAANQTVVQAIAGNDAIKAIAVQGITNGKAIPVSLSSLPAFASTPTVNIGTAPNLTFTNTTFAATQSGTWTVGLSAGSNQIGSISNTSFGISGTLPAFASTPTFNIGTAPNLTITNTTFASTQSGTWTVGLSAGSNAIGAVTANAGTNLNTSLLAVESGGNLASINTKLPSTLGSKTAANSLSVTRGSDIVPSTQLTTTGSTAAIATAGYTLVGVTAKVAGIGTNVVVRVEVSNAGGTNAADWDNAALDNTNTTITANGTKAFKLDCAFAYVRFTWVSASGGSPTIDVMTRLS